MDCLQAGGGGGCMIVGKGTRHATNVRLWLQQEGDDMVRTY